ncbi:hypothetical protein [Jejuia pallidilutea]|jgi:hypothetical protein|uniref:Uncharacterized protein n=1 Tax=Jejuia pallidilutea TaxID=504487 RepID=A0A090VP31_9FLAO|nr:hypothetical protein [Jejuia pallidilutea]PQV51767.1 hypothetical protein CLV33_101697 [Jejuia pallidilutea]GAL66466.1 hypothetical protein JCM19301_2561 [Jejuia pallidilutea]GAL69723.1 hypothetical protein JCM19302_3912 [Jejuia pallidilutea]GAL87844.1 hypothetical protein JCM19538_2206 [Jejuia pallidilutea]
MKKILTIVLAIVGILSIAFLAMIISAGDDAVKAGDASSSVNSIMYIGYIILGLTLAFVVIFSLKNILTNPDTLKSTLRSLGLFALLAVICYFGLAKGVETPLKDGGTLSEGGSKLLGAGLYLFYFLIVIAGLSMLFYGVKKMIK